jgi:spermidine dehydrogenase
VDREKREKDLGMGRPIARRDFLNGFGIAIGSSLAFNSSPWLDLFGLPRSPFSSASANEYYPPALTGMRGTTDAVMEVGHALRDGNTWGAPTQDAETYDLIIVGGGLSGLSAAYFYRKTAGPDAKILILENHDDFGGHARRNEFHTEKDTLLGYGGTQSIAGPKLYSAQAKAGAVGLLRIVQSFRDAGQLRGLDGLCGTHGAAGSGSRKLYAGHALFFVLEVQARE